MEPTASGFSPMVGTFLLVVSGLVSETPRVPCCPDLMLHGFMSYLSSGDECHRRDDHRRAGRAERDHDPSHPLLPDSRSARASRAAGAHRRLRAGAPGPRRRHPPPPGSGLLARVARRALRRACAAAGQSLAGVLGVGEPAVAPGDPGADATPDTAELYGFAELQPHGATVHRGRAVARCSPSLPTTVWDESEAS